MAQMQSSVEPQKFSFFAFNTINTVQVYGAGDARAAFAAVQDKARYFERLFSHTMPESSLVRLNAAGGVPVEVESELADVVRHALHYCEATGGLFDITVGPLVELWNGAGGVCPQASALEQACRHVDWQRVQVEGSTIQLEDPAARLVLGGIAKGYIADALCSLLQHEGVVHGLVNLGGNVKVFGGKPKDKFLTARADAPVREFLQKSVAGFGAMPHNTQNIVPFTVGLRVPRPSYLGSEDAFAAVCVENGSVVTSGIYERGVRAQDGTFYHHILDPHTGMPAETDLVSVSFISETSLEGDGYTTALIAMGLERARAFVESLPNCEAVFMDNSGHVHITSGIGTTIPFRLQ